MNTTVLKIHLIAALYFVEKLEYLDIEIKRLKKKGEQIQDAEKIKAKYNESLNKTLNHLIKTIQ